MRCSWMLLVLLVLSFLSARAHAQAPAPAPTPALTIIRPKSGVRALYLGSTEDHDPGAFARAGAIVGVISAGLLLGGSIAIAVVDDPSSEKITRGVWLGTAAITGPLVGLSAWTARRRTKVEGYKQLRVLGWTTWTCAIANGVLQWWEAFHHEQQPDAFTIVLGGMGALALLSLSFDAFMSGQRATMRARIGMGIGALQGGAGAKMSVRF